MNQMLNFIGTGSAFNTRLGNTSAFISGNHALLLIDCGGSVFHRLMEKNLLPGLKELHIAITHTHPDHVGSLGDVILFAHYMLQIEPSVYFPETGRLRTLLRCMGVEDNMYVLIGGRGVEVTNAGIGAFNLAFIPVAHVPALPSFGLTLEHGGKRCFYSGDSNEIPESVLRGLEDGGIDILYQDTSGMDYEGSPHLSFRRLCEEIPGSLRGKVCCIHHDSSFDLELAKSAGFQVPRIY